MLPTISEWEGHATSITLPPSLSASSDSAAITCHDSHVRILHTLRPLTYKGYPRPPPPHTHTRVCVCVYLHIIPGHVCVCVCVCVCVYLHIIPGHVCVCVYVCACVCVYVYTYI